MADRGGGAMHHPRGARGGGGNYRGGGRGGGESSGGGGEGGYRGGRGGGRGGGGGGGYHSERGGRGGGGRGGGGHHHQGSTGGPPDKERKKENILDLAKYMDKEVTVKFTGGREVKGTLKGYDALMNLVLTDVEESMRDESGNESTRSLGLVVVRGTLLVLISPVDGSEEIANPFGAGDDGPDLGGSDDDDDD